MNRRWVAIGAALLVVAGVAYFARSTGTAEADVCTLSVPERLAVDADAVEFTATKICTGNASPDVTWTASVGSSQTSELRFQRTDSAVTEVYSTDPFGLWIWTMSRTDRRGTYYNEPATEVRARSTVTVVAEQLGDKGTRISFHVSRYDPATGEMKPWPRAAGTIESRTAPADEGTPFNSNGQVTSDGAGNVVITLRPDTERQYRVRFSDAPEAFGSVSDHVYVGKSR